MAKSEEINELVFLLEKTIPDSHSETSVTFPEKLRIRVANLPDSLGLTKRDMARKLDISYPTFHKFFKTTGRTYGDLSVSRLTLVKILNALEEYRDNGFFPNGESQFNLEPETSNARSSAKKLKQVSPEIPSTGEVWLVVERPTVRALVQAVYSSLEELTRAFQASNSIEEDEILTDFQKKALVGILEAALAELRGEVVDTRRFSTIRDLLGKIGRKAAEREGTQAISDAVDSAKDGISDLINSGDAMGIGKDISDLF